MRIRSIYLKTMKLEELTQVYVWIAKWPRHTSGASFNSSKGAAFRREVLLRHGKSSQWGNECLLSLTKNERAFLIIIKLTTIYSVGILLSNAREGTRAKLFYYFDFHLPTKNSVAVQSLLENCLLKLPARKLCILDKSHFHNIPH